MNLNESIEDLPLFSGQPAKPKHLSVTEITQKIRGTLEPAFSEVWVQGEVSNSRPAASGHLYFSLKDAGASISAATAARSMPAARRSAGSSIAVGFS